MRERASADYEQPDKNVADMPDPVALPATKARQAENRGHMFWVLTIGIALAVIALGAIYLGFFAASPPNT